MSSTLQGSPSLGSRVGSKSKPVGTVSTADAAGEVCVDAAGEEVHVTHDHPSSISSKSNKARQLEAKARYAKQLLNIIAEKEKLAQLKLNAHKDILEAELAAIKRSSKAKSNSVFSWVHSVADNMETTIIARPPVPEAVGPMVVVPSIASMPRPVSTNKLHTQCTNTIPVPVQQSTGHFPIPNHTNHNPLPSPSIPLNVVHNPPQAYHCEGMKDLAQAIVSLSQSQSLAVYPL
jgi:hypothetical protein